MMQLSRKVEIKDVVAALASISVSIDRIQQRGTILPTELIAMIKVNEGLLEFRTLLDVQKSKQISEVADNLFELATEFINRARALLVLENVLGVDLDQLMIAYSQAMNAALKVVLIISPAREQEFRVAMQWTK
jgi:hypothetical protein